MKFVVLPARLEFVAQDPIELPAGKESNVFRGALGAALRSLDGELYARFFEPHWEAGPSGYRDAPRPFVLRCKGRSGSIAPGQMLAVDMILFDIVHACWPLLEKAFAAAAGAGLGPARGRARLTKLETGTRHETELMPPGLGKPQSGRLRLRFATPTELKGPGGVVSEPRFDILVRRLAERVRALGRLYQDWTAGWDYHHLLAAAHEVKLTSWEWGRSDTFRRSSSNGQHHSVGGFTGWGEYSGPVGAFLPLLEIGRWTGVGRQTVWGKGEIHIDEFVPERAP